MLPRYGAFRTGFLQEAERIINASKDEGVFLRIMGALAFNMHCPEFDHMQSMMGRSFSDIDFASYKRHSSRITKLFTDLGYAEDFMVRRLYGTSRLVFHDARGNRHCDIFLDKLAFCHDIPFKDRLEADDPTIPLAELLLEKMQIVRIEEKDLIDTIMLLREHEVGPSDKETINVDRIAHLCSIEWGLWRTVGANLRRVVEFATKSRELSDEDRIDVARKVDRLLERVAKEPKTASWTLRARIGERKKWYKDVEEFSEI